MTNIPQSIQTDEELWRSFTDGDEAAFEVLFRRNYPKLFQYGRKFSQDYEFVKDAIQELFTELWHRRGHLSQTPAVRQYLYKALRRKMLRLSTNQLKGNELTDEADRFHVTISPEHILLNEELHEEQRRQVAHWLTFLTSRQREAIYLRYYHDMDYDEMASVMNVGVNAVRSLIYEALKLLRNRLLLVTMLVWALL